MQRLLTWLVALLLVGSLELHAAAAHAQLAASTLVSREDSIRALRTARSRQAAFERIRRNSLPWTWTGGGGVCDERIGRFCLTYDDDAPEEWEPPEEPERVVRARDELLAELDSAASRIPGDAWVAGQRVRYLVEAQRFVAAREAAGDCRAAEWWCLALRAFAEHHAGESGAADTAFSHMLRSMPESTRNEWTDLATILESRPLRRYRELPDSLREEFEEQFWLLADPLVGTAGNDLRSEHFSRNILDRLQERAESTDDMPWGSDLREILVRFGWPSGWERIRSGAPRMLGDKISIVSHYPNADIDLMPPPELLTEAFDPTAGVWDDEDRRPRASYPLPRGGVRLRWFTPFDHQLAVFREGDSAAIVAAYELPADSLEPGTSVDASLSVRAERGDNALIVRQPGAGSRGVLVAGAPQEPVLVSLEAVARQEPWAGRARLGVAIPQFVRGVLASSDLLIFDATENPLPETRAGVVERARGSVRLRPGERIGLYWELYGLERGGPEPLELSLRLVDAETGWLRRMAERVGVLREVQPIRLVWGETADADNVIRRSLSLEIPSDLSPGAYALELTITAADREPLVIRRTVQVVP